jgi:DNA-directed RNA polymerase subunit RPC12/RpoP
MRRSRPFGVLAQLSVPKFNTRRKGRKYFFPLRPLFSPLRLCVEDFGFGLLSARSTSLPLGPEFCPLVLASAPAVGPQWRTATSERSIPAMRCPHCDSQNAEPDPTAGQSHALHHPDFYRCRDCGKQFSIAKPPRPGAVNRPVFPKPTGQSFKRIRGNPRGARGR